MRKLIAAVLLAVFAVLPATGWSGGKWFSPRRLDAESALALARWAGLGPDARFLFEVDPDVNGVNGYFTPGGYACNYYECESLPVTVAVIAGQDVPDPIVRYVLFHEVGHYLQWKQWGGEMFSIPSVELEWDADVRSVNLMCVRHDDGLDAIRAAKEWLFVHFGYEGDYSHGSMADRVSNALQKAEACHRRLEAPFVSSPLVPSRPR